MARQQMVKVEARPPQNVRCRSFLGISNKTGPSYGRMGWKADLIVLVTTIAQLAWRCAELKVAKLLLPNAVH